MAKSLQEIFGFTASSPVEHREPDDSDLKLDALGLEADYDRESMATYKSLATDPTKLSPTPPEYDAIESIVGPIAGGVSIAGKGIQLFSAVMTRLNKVVTAFPTVQSAGEALEAGTKIQNYAVRKSAQFYAQHNNRGKLSKEEAISYTDSLVNDNTPAIKDILDIPMAVVSPSLWGKFFRTFKGAITPAKGSVPEESETFGGFLGEKYYETLMEKEPSAAWKGMMNFSIETLVTAPSAVASIGRKGQAVGQVHKLLPSKKLRPFEIKELRKFYAKWGVEKLARDPAKARIELKRLTGLAKYTDDVALEKALTTKAIDYKKELELMLGRPLRTEKVLPAAQVKKGREVLDIIFEDAAPARKAATLKLKEARARKFRKASAARDKNTGENAAKLARWSLRGEDFSKDFVADLSFITQDTKDEIFDVINSLSEWDAQIASEGMWKLLKNKLPHLSEVKALEKAFGKGLVTQITRFTQQPLSLGDSVVDLINVPRALQTSFDMGAPFRQGNFGLKAGYADEWGAAFVDMLKAGRSEEYATLIDSLGREGVRGAFYKNIGLEITDLSRFAKLSAREEQYLSTFAENIPILGKGVKWSERVHAAFLNQFRMNITDSVVAAWRAEGRTLSTQDLKSLAEYVNHVSGRGDLDSASRVVTKLIGKTGTNVKGFKVPTGASGVFYSPKLFLSKIQVHTDVLTTESPLVRKLIARDLVKYYYTNTQLLRLAKQGEKPFGWTVETDPTSTEYGKIKAGNSRYDVWGPMNPMMRFVARMESGVRKDTISDEIRDIERDKLTIRFGRGKLAPALGMAIDIGTKSNFVGEDVDVTTLKGIGDFALDTVVPLVANDIIDAIRFGDNGFLAKAASGSAFFGQGVVSYEPTAYQKAYTKKETLAQELYGKSITELEMFERMDLLEAAKYDPEIQLLEREGQFERSNDLGEIYADTERASEKQIKKKISKHSKMLIDSTFAGILGVNRSIFPNGKQLKLNDSEFKTYKNIIARNIDLFLDDASPTGSDFDSLYLDADVVDQLVNKAIQVSQIELMDAILRQEDK